MCIWVFKLYSSSSFWWCHGLLSNASLLSGSEFRIVSSSLLRVASQFFFLVILKSTPYVQLLLAYFLRINPLIHLHLKSHYYLPVNMAKISKSKPKKSVRSAASSGHANQKNLNTNSTSSSLKGTLCFLPQFCHLSVPMRRRVRTTQAKKLRCSPTT